MRAKRLWGALLWLGVVPVGAARADEVSLTRLVVRAQSTQLESIDEAETDRFCGDADGCQVVLRLEAASVAKVVTARLFVHTAAASLWFSSETGGKYFSDGDGAANAAARLETATGGCAIDDGDPFDPGLDNDPGFELVAYGPAGVSCTLTMSD